MNKYNLLLPIAGKAQRFIDAGHTNPKPLIIANYRHIIDWALDSIDHRDCNLIFAVRSDHINSFCIDAILKKKFGNDIKIVVVDKITEGAVSTCELAREHIDNDFPLFIYTPDVYFEKKFNPNDIDHTLDGFLLTFKANSPAHSYVKLDEYGFVTKTAEKEVISDNAAVGVYYYKTGRMFLKYATLLRERNIRVKNEFYICPMYNLMIKDGLRIKTNPVEKLHVLGTPEELDFFDNCVAPRFGSKPIGLCGDHSGFELKEACKKILKEQGLKYMDYGPYVSQCCDYNEYVSLAANSLQDKKIDFCIGFCRTGQGINILANKYKNIRCALTFDSYTAQYSIRHNCANFFAVPTKYVDEQELSQMLSSWKSSSFDGGRHMTRMQKAVNNKMENENG